MTHVVEEWTEFGHTFTIEKIDPPVRKGAGDRHYRLWCNGEPAYGGQWHYTIESARRRASYVLAFTYQKRIATLELMVNNLEKQVHDLIRSARI